MGFAWRAALWRIVQALDRPLNQVQKADGGFNSRLGVAAHQALGDYFRSVGAARPRGKVRRREEAAEGPPVDILERRAVRIKDRAFIKQGAHERIYVSAIHVVTSIG